MEKSIPVLLFHLSNQLLGLDCAEINKVILEVASLEAQQVISAYKKEKKYYSLWNIFQTDKKNEISSFILIKQTGSNKNYLVEVPSVSTIINLDVTRIKIVPEYLKIKQNPFFVWGVSRQETELIVLITFSFFAQEKGYYGQ